MEHNLILTLVSSVPVVHVTDGRIVFLMNFTLTCLVSVYILPSRTGSAMHEH